MDNEYLLSICIPTYNRAEKLKQCLSNIADDYNENSFDDIEIIISDNCSEDETLLIVDVFKNILPIKYYRQNENIGVTRNVVFLGNTAKGKFIWHIADDDIVNPGVITKVIQILQDNKDINSIFINYRTLSWGMWYSGESGLIKNGKQFILNNFEKLRGGFMFLTANVLLRDRLVDLYKKINIYNPRMLAISIIFPIVSIGNGPFYILDGENIVNNDLTVSWSQKKKEVAVRDRFECIECLEQFGYSRKEVIALCKKLFVREKYKITKALHEQKFEDYESFKSNRVYLKNLLGQVFELYERAYIIVPLREKMKTIYKKLK